MTLNLLMAIIILLVIEVIILTVFNRTFSKSKDKSDDNSYKPIAKNSKEYLSNYYLGLEVSDRNDITTKLSKDIIESLSRPTFRITDVYFKEPLENSGSLVVNYLGFTNSQLDDLDSLKGNITRMVGDILDILKGSGYTPKVIYIRKSNSISTGVKVSILSDDKIKLEYLKDYKEVIKEDF